MDGLTGDEKREVLRDYQKASGYDLFIETGTADGNTLHYLADYYKRLFSVEVGLDFYENAVRRMVDKPNATVIYGDSSKVLEWLLPTLDPPAVFWLDAHYNGRGNGRNPIQQELLHVFHRKKPHWILIDDAREFGADPAYPTMEWVEEFLYQEMIHGSCNYKFTVEDDIMRIVPGL